MIEPKFYTYEEWMKANGYTACPECEGKGRAKVSCICPCCGQETDDTKDGDCEECEGEGFVDADGEPVSGTRLEYESQKANDLANWKAFVGAAR